MIVQESARGITKVKGARKCQRHPPCPQQNDRISTSNVHRPETRFLESQHNLAKYIRCLKLLKGKSVTITDLGIFNQFDGILSSIKNVVMSTFQAIQNCHLQRHAGKKFRISGKLQSCKFTGVLYKPVII